MSATNGSNQKHRRGTRKGVPSGVMTRREPGSLRPGGGSAPEKGIVKDVTNRNWEMSPRVFRGERKGRQKALQHNRQTIQKRQAGKSSPWDRTKSRKRKKWDRGLAGGAGSRR